MAIELNLQTILEGTASGPLLILEEGLSFWGGLDPHSGEIVDRQHPQCGAIICGTLLVLPSPRGSTAAPGALLECLNVGKGPAGIILLQPDITPVAAILAGQLLGLPTVPVAQLTANEWPEGIVSGSAGHLADSKLTVTQFAG